MIGVSLAYFVSKFSNRFSPTDAAAGIEDLPALGFFGFQLEVFHREILEPWARTGAAEIRRKSSDVGLKIHQLAAHFMLADFSDWQSLISNAAIDQMKVVLEMVDRFDFDTGHAWACKENFYLIPAKLGPRILGTHLCDNFGNENLSLRPGAGSIDWSRLIAVLKACGYNGPWDIEIISPPHSVAEEYGAGRKFIEALVR